MNLTNYIRDVADFPKPGIVFKDITPLLGNPEAFCSSIDQFCECISGAEVVVALDARGFIFGAAVAEKLKIPFVPVRKKGKLPYTTFSQSYQLEYGENTFEIHSDAFVAGTKVAMIDDLLATGGSMKAACQLVEKLGGQIISINFLIELGFLQSETYLEKYPKHSLITYS